jgi:hypothetical protein
MPWHRIDAAPAADMTNSAPPSRRCTPASAGGHPILTRMTTTGVHLGYYVHEE